MAACPGYSTTATPPGAGEHQVFVFGLALFAPGIRRIFLCFLRFRVVSLAASVSYQERRNHVRDVGVAGSNPVTPTIERRARRDRWVKLWLQASPGGREEIEEDLAELMGQIRIP